MKKGVVIETSGESRIIELDDTLEQLQREVGGLIEAVTLPNGVTMWLNEEGKLQQLDHNKQAQFIFDHTFGPGVDIVVGNAVITGGADEEGQTLGLTDEQLLAYKFVGAVR